MVQINNMTQLQKLEQTFYILVNQGPTTTLDVKLKLRNEYPDETWNQDFISYNLAVIEGKDSNITFHDNGTYRTYMSINDSILNQSPKSVYTYTTSTGITLTTTTWLDMVEAAAKLGDKVHWSTSKEKFIGLYEMHENHLLNAIYKLADDMGPKEFAEFLQTSPYIKELTGRYPS